MIEGIVRVAEQISEGGRNLVFTGAGISTESGIPDYRSKGGLWDKFRPVYFDEFMSSKEARIEYWQRKTELYPDLVKAKPNSAHQAVAKLSDMGLIQAVITQNIDGLHQESGVPDDKVIELHGNTRRVRCMSCDRMFPLPEIHERIMGGDLAPECDCGGYLKPDTVSFGQSMPTDKMDRAVKLSLECDFMLVIGSTLLVQPASLLPGYAKRNGAFLAIINLSETPYDDSCDALVCDKAGDVLSLILETVERIQKGLR